MKEEGNMEIECPRCHELCDGENVSGHTGFDNYACGCGLEFVYDDNRSLYISIKGDVMKEKV